MAPPMYEPKKIDVNERHNDGNDHYARRMHEPKERDEEDRDQTEPKILQELGVNDSVLIPKDMRIRVWEDRTTHRRFLGVDILLDVRQARHLLHAVIHRSVREGDLRPNERAG